MVLNTIRRLSLGVTLILLAAAVLLFSDRPRPQPAAAEQVPLSVAVFQMASQPIIDEAYDGLIQGLEEAGFSRDRGLTIRRFNAEGDLATANTIARELVSGNDDLVITLTTSALQAMANANRNGQKKHLFCLVSDPAKAGVGIEPETLAHPPHLTGIGTFPPVDEALRMARQVNPRLARVGIAWNPGEINSEICTKLAREVCHGMQIELLEATVENSAGVKEAVSSLIARGAEALLVGGDVTMIGAIDLVIRSARDARIPVFTCIPGNAVKGTLFDIGANYFEVGRKAGALAGRVLHGAAIKDIPVELALPPKTFLNPLAIAGLNGQWAFPEELMSKADAVIEEGGVREKARPASRVTSAPAKKWRVHLISYVKTADTEDAETGLKDGLAKAGLVAGRDFDLKSSCALGDMAVLIGMVDAAVADRADLILTISSQALQAAAQRAGQAPIVFTMVADPFAAGAGKTDKDHLPNITGAYGANDAAGMMPIIQQLAPKARRLGALYAPAEVNAVYSHELLQAAAKEAGYELTSLAINSPSEAADVTRSLCGQQIDLLCLPNSNLAASCFPAIIQPARQAHVPVVGFLSALAPQGACVVLSRDFHDMGVDSGELAAGSYGGKSRRRFHFIVQRRAA